MVSDDDNQDHHYDEAAAAAVARSPFLVAPTHLVALNPLDDASKLPLDNIVLIGH